MQNRLMLIMILVGVLLSGKIQAFTAEALTIGEVITLQYPSAVLQQNRTIKVYLPQDYDKSIQTYPTLYLLDGERHLAHAVLASRLHQELGNIPRQIIVAINNLEQDGARENDFYHQKDKFAQFIGTELQPLIDKTFRSSKSATLYGHSLAAYFAVDLLAKQPALFDRYIAASPPLQRHVNELYQQLVSSRTPTAVKRLYISLAPLGEEGEAVFSAYQQFIGLLSAKTPDNVRWHEQVMAEQSHISNYYISFFNGISAVFAD